MPLIADLPGYAELAAARADNVFVADGNPEILAEMLHPRAFEPRHEGTAWRRFSAT